MRFLESGILIVVYSILLVGIVTVAWIFSQLIVSVASV